VTESQPRPTIWTAPRLRNLSDMDAVAAGTVQNWAEGEYCFVSNSDTYICGLGAGLAPAPAS